MLHVRSRSRSRAAFAFTALVPLGLAAELGELDACVANLPECVELAASPENAERTAVQLLRAWLEASSKDVSWPEVKPAVMSHLLSIAQHAEARPELALGLGQAFHSFFWWGAAPNTDDHGGGRLGLSVDVVMAAMNLHEVAIRYAGCDSPDTPRDQFLLQKCPCRWRFLLLFGAELALDFVNKLQDYSGAASLLQRTAATRATIASLPFFRGAPLLPLRLNQNWDYFPDATHWPIWPRSAWPPLAQFLEENAATFAAGLEALLADDGDARFEAAARFQSGLTAGPKAGWTRLKLIHSGGKSDLCGVPYLAASCALLAQRYEIGPSCGTELSGASIARLLPGSELKPHFGTHPRLTAHLGLRTPVGATMTIGGDVAFWQKGKVIVFDDTYVHHVSHSGSEPRFVLVAWFCHPCDLGWREDMGEAWRVANPLPDSCGSGGGGYKAPPVPGYATAF